MGIYYITRFYKHQEDRETYVQLGDIEPIIEPVDVERGYILKAELLEFFSQFVSEEDITDTSVIEEYLWTSFDENADLQLTRSLFVR
jgi:hypothetical protein